MALTETGEFRTSARSYTRDVMRQPVLGPDEEVALSRRWREARDEAALHRLVGAHLRLVVAMAVRYRNYGLPLSDLVQEGNVGLMRAAERFDPARGVRFATYAMWWIRASMHDFILRNWSIVRTGTTAAQKSLFFNLRRLRARIEGGADALSAAARAEIARTLHVSEGDVEDMAVRMSGPDRSLNAPLGADGGGDLQDIIADDRQTPDEACMNRHDEGVRAQWLARALERLTDRERLVIRERRLDEEGVTLESLGARLGVSKERVRQIEKHALEKLRRALLDMVGDPVTAGLI